MPDIARTLHRGALIPREEACANPPTSVRPHGALGRGGEIKPSKLRAPGIDSLDALVLRYAVLTFTVQLLLVPVVRSLGSSCPCGLARSPGRGVALPAQALFGAVIPQLFFGSSSLPDQGCCPGRYVPQLMTSELPLSGDYVLRWP